MSDQNIKNLQDHCFKKIRDGLPLCQKERIFVALMNSKKPLPCYYFANVLGIMNYRARIMELRSEELIPVMNHSQWSGRERHSQYYIEGVTEPRDFKRLTIFDKLRRFFT